MNRGCCWWKMGRVLPVFLGLFLFLYVFILSVPALRLLSLYGNLGVVLSFLCWHVAEFYSRHFPSKKILNAGNKAVLISGCDSGFGHILAKRLYHEGYVVFAGCLFPDGEGASSLKTSCSADRMHVVPLDVTKDEEVQKAIEEVKNKLGDRRELWALINNAGVAMSGLVEWGGMDIFEKQVDVNVLGTIRLTKACLPLLRNSKGRIVIMGSYASRITFPGLVGYSASKHAIYSFAEGLRQEMQKWEVRVITIMPALYKTSITDANNVIRSIQKAWEETTEETQAAYGKEVFLGACDKAWKNAKSANPNVSDVVNAMMEAVTAEDPQPVRKISGSLSEFLSLAFYDVLPPKIRDFLVLFSDHGSLPDHWLSWLKREFLRV